MRMLLHTLTAHCVMRTAMETRSLCRREHSESRGTGEITAIPVFDEQDEIEGVILRIDDITERKAYIRRIEKSERRIAANNQLLTTIIDNMPASLFIKDIDDDFRYVLVNKNFKELMRIADRDITGSTDYDFFAREDAGKFRANDISMVEKGETSTFDEEIFSRSDNPIYFHSIKTPLFNTVENKNLLVGISLDITDRILKQHKIEYDKTLLELTFMAGGITPWEWDIAADNVRSSRENFLNSGLGCTFAQNLEKFVLPEYKEVVERAFADISQGVTDQLNCKIQIKYNNSTEWMHIIGKRVLDPRTGQPKAFGVARFITEEVRQQEELVYVKEANALKSAFLANMSHEIRTPLNSIVGFSELIHLAESEEERNSFMQIISNNSERLLNLINDILDLSKIEAGYINYVNTRFNLTELFNELALTFKHKVKEGVELVYREDYGPCFVILDKIRVSQLVTNFLTNAIKFTTKGSICMGYEAVDGGVKMYVKDTGCGMSKENIAKVFDRFEKFNPFEQGTGLGMSICKAITDAYHGDIGVISVPGEGSLFYVWLPTETFDSSDKS